MKFHENLLVIDLHKEPSLEDVVKELKKTSEEPETVLSSTLENRTLLRFTRNMFRKDKRKYRKFQESNPYQEL